MNQFRLIAIKERAPPQNLKKKSMLTRSSLRRKMSLTAKMETKEIENKENVNIERLNPMERNEQSLVNFKIDVLVKESAEAVLSSMGLNTSAYLGMCLRKLAQDGSLPFELKTDPEFWVAEAQIGKAAQLIKTGLFDDISDFRSNLISEVSDRFIPYGQEFLKVSQSQIVKDDKRETSKPLLKTDIGEELLFVWLSTLEIELRVLNLEELLEFFNPETAAITNISLSITEYDGYKKLIEKLSKEITDTYAFIGKSIDDFCSKLQTQDVEVPPKAKDAYIDNARFLDSTIEDVISEYKAHKKGLMLRFVGSEASISRLESEIEKNEEAKAKRDSVGEQATFDKRLKDRRKLFEDDIKFRAETGI